MTKLARGICCPEMLGSNGYVAALAGKGKEAREYWCRARYLLRANLANGSGSGSPEALAASRLPKRVLWEQYSPMGLDQRFASFTGHLGRRSMGKAMSASVIESGLPPPPKCCRAGCLSSTPAYRRKRRFRDCVLCNITLLPRERRAELEAAVVARRLSDRQIVAQLFAGSQTAKSLPCGSQYPEVDISVPFAWSATAAEVTEQVRAAIED
jgi:hypothetical protein